MGVAPTMKTVAVDYLHGFVLIAHGPGSPSDEDWAPYLELIRNHGHDVRGQIVWSLGGAPTASQRGDAIDAVPLDATVPPAAIMTRSRPVRGIVTVFNWFFPKRYKAFSLDDMDGAMAYVGVESWHREKLRLALRVLQQFVRETEASQPESDSRR